MISNFSRRLSLTLLLLLLPLSAGCWNQVEVNKALVVTGLGYDLAPNQLTKVTAQVIAPQSTGSGEGGGGGGKKPYLTFTATDSNSAKALRSLTLTVPRQMLWAHASGYIIGDEMAHNGLSLLNDFFDRNRNIRKNGMFIIAKDTSAEEVLKAGSPISQNPMFDLITMLELQDQQVGIYTPVQLNHYLNALVTPGIDPILPSVEVKEEGKEKLLKLGGMAVFQDDKLVAYLNENQSRGYRWLRRRPSIQGGLITISSPKTEHPVLMEVLRASTSVKLDTKDNQIKFKIKVNEEGNFYEQNDVAELLTPDLIRSMEARTATKIANEVNDYLKRSQELNCDCVGFGWLISQTDPALWDQIGPQWRDIYPEVKFDIDVMAQLRRTGLTNKTLIPKS